MPNRAKSNRANRPKNNNRPRRKNQRQVAVVNGGTSSSKYRLALLQPFNKAAVGAQIPDLYCAPTATYHIKSRFTVTTNASGVADLVILPNACFNAVCPVGSCDGASDLQTRDGIVFPKSLMFTNTNNLSGKLVNYRIVAAGVRVKAITSMTDSKGALVVGVIPVESISPGVTTVGGTLPSVDANQTLGAWYECVGVPYTGVGAAATISAGGIDNLPIATSCSVLRLAEKPLEIRPKPISSYNTQFRSTSDRQYGFDTVNQPAGAIDCGDGSYCRVNGMETVVMKLHGCAASTPVLEVEVIYHLEGTPSLNSSASTQYAAGTGTPTVDYGAFTSTLEMVSKAPTFIEGIVDGALKVMGAAGKIGGYLGYV